MKRFNKKQQYDILAITRGSAIGMLLSRRSAFGNKNSGEPTIKNVTKFWGIAINKDPNKWAEWEIKKVIKEGNSDTVRVLNNQLINGHNNN